AKGAFVLIKPQFECENKGIGKSGIVGLTRHKDVVEKVLSYAAESYLMPVEIIDAPLKKGKKLGYILHLKKFPEAAFSPAPSEFQRAAAKIASDTEKIIDAARDFYAQSARKNPGRKRKI
ncbi:MAG: hypothetical protein ACI4SH_00670, partial [Candidatus Scatosoma sp.]